MRCPADMRRNILHTYKYAVHHELKTGKARGHGGRVSTEGVLNLQWKLEEIKYKVYSWRRGWRRKKDIISEAIRTESFTAEDGLEEDRWGRSGGHVGGQ